MLMYADKGDNLYNSISKVQKTLKNPTDSCELEFNEIRIDVSKNSNIHDLITIYNLKHTINRLKLGYHLGDD